MKNISEKRHDNALEKELRFWQKPDILAAQKFRTERYVPLLKEMIARRGEPVIRLIDVGCGPSCLGQHITAEERWFLDPLLEKYKPLFGDAIPAGHHLSKKLEDAALDENYFELVLCLNALDHVRDPWLVLRQIHRILKPGGLFILTLYTRHPLLAFLRNLQEYFHLSTDAAHPYTFTKRKMESDLNDAGLAIQTTKMIEKDRDRVEWFWVATKIQSPIRR